MPPPSRLCCQTRRLGGEKKKEKKTHYCFNFHVSRSFTTARLLAVKLLACSVCQRLEWRTEPLLLHLGAFKVTFLKHRVCTTTPSALSREAAGVLIAEARNATCLWVGRRFLGIASKLPPSLFSFSFVTRSFWWVEGITRKQAKKKGMLFNFYSLTCLCSQLWCYYTKGWGKQEKIPRPTYSPPLVFFLSCV